MKKIVLNMLVVALLTLCIILVFSPVIFSDYKSIAGEYDVYRYFAPWTFYIDHVLHTGEFPLWNGLVYCGMPVAGNPQSFLFYPPNLIRSLCTFKPTPEKTAFSLAALMGLHLLFLALGTYTFSRAHGLSRSGSLASSIAFAFSAIMVMRMCDYIFVFTMAWLPWILLCIKATLDSESSLEKLKYSICGGLLLGLSILGGFVQIINLQGFTIALYSLFYFLLNNNWGQFTSVRRIIVSWIVAGCCMSLIVLIGVGIAVVVLLPTAQLAGFTVRSIGDTTVKLSNLWGYSPLMMYQSMVVYPGMTVVGESIRNSGITAILLACMAFSHKRQRDIWMFFAMYAILFECSFGPPLPIGAMLEKFTPFALSAYTRAYDFALFPLSLMAGYGLDAMRRPLPTRGQNICRTVAVTFVAIICLAPLYQWALAIKHMPVYTFVIIVPIVAAILMAAMGLAPCKRWVLSFASMCLVVLLFSEILTWNASFVPHLTKKKVNDVVNIPYEELAIPATNNRATDPISNRYLYRLRFAMNGIDPMHVGAIRDLISGPPRDKMSKRLVQDWETTRENLRGNLLLKRSFWLSRQYVVGNLPGKREPYPAATTVFMNESINAPIPAVSRDELPRSSISSPEMKQELPGDNWLHDVVMSKTKKTYTLSTELPAQLQDYPVGPARAVHSALLLTFKSTTTATIDTVIEESNTDLSEFGIRHAATAAPNGEQQVEVPLPDYPKMNIKITVDNTGSGTFEFTSIALVSDPMDEDGLIKIKKRTANTIDLEIGPLPEHRILTFLDLHYPGWKAYVDGNETPILRANEQFKAIVLAPGNHSVTFRFEPAVVMISAGVSATTAAVCLLALLACLFVQRKAKTSRANTDDSAVPA